MRGGRRAERGADRGVAHRAHKEKAKGGLKARGERRGDGRRETGEGRREWGEGQRVRTKGENREKGFTLKKGKDAMDSTLNSHF